VGNTGNIYAVDNNYQNYYQVLGTIAPSGTVTLTPLAVGSTGLTNTPEGSQLTARRTSSSAATGR